MRERLRTAATTNPSAPIQMAPAIAIPVAAVSGAEVGAAGTTLAAMSTNASHAAPPRTHVMIRVAQSLRDWDIEANMAAAIPLAVADAATSPIAGGSKPASVEATAPTTAEARAVSPV